MLVDMTRHYSDLKLFRWLRESVFKIEKPYALPWGEWDRWRDETKAKYPLGWFMTETLPDILEKPAEWTVDPINDLRYYVRMRWGFKSHLIKTGLKPGQYHDASEKILHGSFNELVDFIEIDCACHRFTFSKEDCATYDVPWWQRFWFLRWGAWRCPQAGLDHVRWETTLDHPDLDPTESAPWQAEAAREKLALYFWWTQTRPNRPDPLDASGWTEICRESDDKGYDSFSDHLPAEFKARQKVALDLSRKIEEAYDAEDEEMLMRLIKIRKSLWT